MHPNGQMPAYEIDLNDTNPPIHAWACRRVFDIDAARTGNRDYDFLARCFQKLLLNFTWGVNRKDRKGRNIFTGGFLGLDNIGVIDRSQLPDGTHLEQADATAWMGFYCAQMLGIALELALVDTTYEDLASKFFEHFITICDAINQHGGKGLWDDAAGIYQDQLHLGNEVVELPIRSIVGLLPITAVGVIEQATIDRLPDFKKRLRWFLKYRSDLARHVSYMQLDSETECDHAHCLLAIPSRERLKRVVTLMLDEDEFLSHYGIRSLSKWHKAHPFILTMNGENYRVGYEPGESQSHLFGGNSNWRGPIWMPINYLFIESLRKYDHFYGDSLTIFCRWAERGEVTLGEAADEIERRCIRLFEKNQEGVRPYCYTFGKYAAEPHWRDLIQFHEW